MSISGALNNALSGLNATTRMADVVSNNVANALTEGYGRREVQLGSRSGGASGGVQVLSIDRLVDRTLLGDRRDADAAFGHSAARAGFLTAVNDAYGEPGNGLSLADRLSDAEAALVVAAASPESQPRQAEAVTAFSRLVDSIGTVADTIQTGRTRADAAIATDVAALNDGLVRIEQLNGDIARQSLSGTGVASLMDERQRAIDTVARIVPVREIDRGNGRVALMTASGTMLIDGPAAEIGFSRAALVTPYQSREAGTLSGLTINGRDIDLDRATHGLSGGTLEGNLAVRDTLGPEAQAALDALSRDLLERFADPAVDPTLGAGDPGLLTDDGAAFDPADETGLSQRLALNAAVDPDAGGALWRLRDGLGASVPGYEGDGNLLRGLGAALSDARTIVSGPASGIARSAAAHLADTISVSGGALLRVEAESAHAGSRLDVLTARQQVEGVDTDQEMQRLLMLEQAYAANARVIQTVQAMLDELMRL